VFWALLEQGIENIPASIVCRVRTIPRLLVTGGKYGTEKKMPSRACGTDDISVIWVAKTWAAIIMTSVEVFIAFNPFTSPLFSGTVTTLSLEIFSGNHYHPANTKVQLWDS